MSEASERENAVMDIINKIKSLPCTCPFGHCPFHHSCELCVKNHRMDGTLPHCMLPPEPERDNCGRCSIDLACNRYPDCHHPFLWVVHYLRHPERLLEDAKKFRDDKMRRKAETIAKILSMPEVQALWRSVDNLEEEEAMREATLKHYRDLTRRYWIRMRRPR